MSVTLRLGLTGGIGSGKSSVAQILGQLGAAIVDADAISRAMTAARGPAIDSIAIEFGPDFITADGALNRDKMRALAYTDASARLRLESIIHPLVGQEVSHQAQIATQAGRPCIVFDIPLLVESGRWRQIVDQILVVDCSPEVQIRRVIARNGLERDAIVKIIQSQAPRKVRLSAADIVINNEQISLVQLEDEVNQAAHWLGL
jgi:dephospho-CoA kinase